MTPSPDLPGLDLAAVTTWLASQGVTLAGPVSASLFPGGRSNVTYRLTGADGASVVLRRPPLGHVLPSAHDMAREYRVLAGLNTVGYPTPQTIALCEDLTVNGSAFLVMEYVEGRIIATADDAAVLAPGDRERISAALIDSLARLHGADVDAAGLEELGRPEGYLPRQLARWTKQWELTKTRDLPAMEALRGRIEEALAPLPTDLPWSLVHGDYRLDNVILAPASAEVRAVLDWEMSTLGDPLADLALTLVYWTQGSDRLRHRVPVAEHLTDADGFWSRARIIDAYADATGLGMAHLDACTALACFKLAVITESIHARTLSGKQLGAAASDVHAMGIATEALAELGLNVSDIGTVAGLAS